MSKTGWLGIGAIVLIFLGIIYFVNLRAKQTTNTQTESAPIEPIASKNFEATRQVEKMTRKTYTSPPGSLTPSEIKGKKIRVKTEKGDIVFELFEEAPLASSNFIFLTNEKFYDGLTFHRREENFVIQGGDPAGTGSSGTGYTFKEEGIANNGKYERGIVAMAKKPNEPAGTGGSQFFIMLSDYPLPPDYAIFGKVSQGMNVVDKIQVGDIMSKVIVE